MNFKKFILSLATSGLLFGSTIPASSQTSDDESYTYLIPILDLILNSDTECTEPSALSIVNATANGNEGDNVAARAHDNSIETRWSSDALNPNIFPAGVGIITFELASRSTVTDINIAWFRSDERTTAFSVERSTDNVNWIEVVPATRSFIAPESEFQANDIDDAQANFIRIIGTGNDNSAFTSISEVVINGCSSIPSSSSSSSSSSTSSSGGPDPDFLLDPDLEPWENFDLSVWGLDSPALSNISANDERGVRIDDFEFVALRNGPNDDDYEDASNLFFGANSNVESSEPYFFTGPDGGMVFKSPVDGGRTSSGARFPRSELREYVRGGVPNRANGNTISVSGANENNWVLGYQPQNLILDDNTRTNDSDNRGIQNVGGRNGHMTATLRVNKVTETGRDDDIGVTIIGQIHAEDDEPLRLYYRKLPNNDLGSVYFIHEIRQDQSDDGGTIDGQSRRGNDLEEVNLIGSRDDDAENPVGGIALDELFSYEIIAEGSIITVILIRGDADGEEISQASFDMATLMDPRDNNVSSGYNRRFEWMYFKAGAYTQNNVAVEDGEPGAARTGFGPDGTEADYDQVTFYRLSVSHDSNDCSQCE